YAPDLRAAAAEPARIDADAPDFSAGGFDRLAAILAETLAALGRDAIVVGHGMGGLLALRAVAHPRVRAAVAMAPMLPGFRPPLVMGAANCPARWLGRARKPPRGAVLFDLLADAEPFQREALVRALVADDARAALEVVRGGIGLDVTEPGEGGSAVPRLIVAGGAGPVAPLDLAGAFAVRLGAAPRLGGGRGR